MRGPFNNLASSSIGATKIDVIEKLCCHTCLKPISEKQAVPKDNRGAESPLLRRDMTHTLK